MPSGASKGDYEAVELRDGGKDFGGKGVSNAVENVNKILGPELVRSKISCAEQWMAPKTKGVWEPTRYWAVVWR